MLPEDKITLLIRYIQDKGSLTENEKIEIASEIESNAAFKDDYLQLKKMYGEGNIDKVNEENGAVLFERLQTKIENTESSDLIEKHFEGNTNLSDSSEIMFKLVSDENFNKVFNDRVGEKAQKQMPIKRTFTFNKFRYIAAAACIAILFSLALNLKSISYNLIDSNLNNGSSPISMGGVSFMIPICDLNNKPEKFKQEEIHIQGEVISVTETLLGVSYYTIKQNGQECEVDVITENKLPDVKSKVTVDGMIRKLVAFGNLKEIVILEMDRYSK